MENNAEYFDDSILTKSELDSLPVIDKEDMADDTYFLDDFIYNHEGLVIGKTPEFAIRKDWIYSRKNPDFKTGQTAENCRMLKPITWSELKRRPFPKEQWRIQGLIPMAGLTIIASAAGEKKTWCALHMAKSIACGFHFLGQEKFPSVKGKVLYIDAEIGPKQMLERGMKLGFDQIPEDNMLLITGKDINFKTDEGFEQLTKMISQFGSEVIFVDTLRGVAGGMNEDKAEEVRAFLKRFSALKNKGISIVMIDHCRKPHRTEGYAPKKEQLLGSQDKVANAETVLMLRSDLHNPVF